MFLQHWNEHLRLGSCIACLRRWADREVLCIPRVESAIHHLSEPERACVPVFFFWVFKDYKDT